MNILVLSIRDYGSSALGYVNAINKCTEHKARLVKIQKSTFSRPGADLVLSSLGASTEVVNEWAREADIIHFKGDEVPTYDWFNIKIPRHKPLICTVGGSVFRRGVNKGLALGKYNFEDYIKVTAARTTITPELNYPGFESTFIPHAYDTDSIEQEWKYKEVPLISHCFWEKNKKGTDLFQKACDILHTKGYKFDVDIIENVPNKECLQRVKRSTIFFDQCLTGWYGMAAVEAMSYGIPVVGSLCPEGFEQSNERFVDGIPIINVMPTVEGITNGLESLLLSNQRKLQNLSDKTREFVIRNHSYESVSSELISLYESVLSGNKVREDKIEYLTEESILFFSRKNSENFADNYFNGFTLPISKVITHLPNIPSVKNRIHDHKGWVWLEWGGEFTKKVLDDLNTKTKIVVRMHDWEIESGYVKDIDFSKVSLLWFINRDARKDFFNLMPHLINKSSIFLPNAINCDAIPFVEKKYGKRILAVSVCFKQRKGYKRLIDIFNLLHQKDTEWSLTIKSPAIESDQMIEMDACKEYAKKLKLKIKFDYRGVRIDKLKYKEDLIEYFKDYDVIISSSYHEGFHYIIGEGVLAGLKPIVWNWEWGRATDFWPWVYDDYNSIVDELLSWSKRENNTKIEEARLSRHYVVKRFDSHNLAPKLEKILFNKKTILIASHNHPYKFNPRGGEKSFLFIIDMLKGLGFNVIVAVRNFKSKEEVVEQREGVTYYNFHEPVYSNNTHYTREFERLCVKFKPDVILSYGLTMKPSSDVAIKLGIPYILGIRWWRCFCSLPPGNMMTRDIEFSITNEFREMFQKAAKVITNNKYAVDVIRRFYGIEAVSSFVPIIPNTTRSISGNRFGYLLVVTPNKDLGEYDLISKLVKLMPNEKFLLVHVDKAEVGRYKSLGKKITIEGYKEDMAEIYSKAKILLYPAYKNDVCGTSRVIAEAMSYGVPSICNNRSGMDEIHPFLVSRDAKPMEWVTLINHISETYEYHSDIAYKSYLNYDMFSHLDVFVDLINEIIYRDSE